MDNRPIGVFDSGLGGLTAVKELNKLMPSEDIVYFGDTGRVPYGTKGRETIVKFAAQDIRFLLGFGVKAIVIACGTVSTNALDEACALSPVPVVGVIRPSAKAAARATKNGKIGVLGTSATIRSGSFQKEVLKIMPAADVISRACPLFVPLVENGYFDRDNPVAGLVAHEYLDGLKSKVDTLILGCTHYPILQDVISGVVGSGVRLIDTGREAACETAELLKSEGLLSANSGPGTHRFFVSDSTEDFSRLAGIFMGCPIGGVRKIDIEKY